MSAALPASPDMLPPTAPRQDGPKLVVQIVGAVAFAHLLNDLIQAVLPAIYPMLKEKYHLSFGQIGWIALIYQVTASLLQPWVGLYTDKRPLPYLLPLGMIVTLVGVGANMVGGFAVNKDIWEGLPEDVRQVLTELGPEYSARNAELLTQRYDAVLAELAADPSVTLTTLPAEERQKWVDALPDLAAQWGSNLPEGKALLDAYMAALREAGATPARDWKLE